MERYTCRTCLSITEENICTRLSETCYAKKTLRDILVDMIPQMASTVSEDDVVCKFCLKTLKSFVRFINKCLAIEARLIDATGEDSNVVENVDVSENTGVDGQVVEDIEIIVEEDLQDYFKQISDEDPVENVDHDHAYMKSDDSDLEEEEFSTSEMKTEPEYMEESDNNIVSTEISNWRLSEKEAKTITNPKIKLYNTKTVMNTEEENSSQELKEEIDEESNDMVFLEGEEYLPYKNLEEGCFEEDASNYICEVCGESFEHEFSLIKHLPIHDPKIICNICSKRFKNKAALNAHYKLKHLNLAPFKCDICQMTFGRADYLKKHLNYHYDEDSKIHKSRIAGKFLRFKNTEKLDVPTKRQGLIQNVKMSVNKISARLNKEYSDDPLPCKICGKYYNGIQKLKVHLQTHLVVKRYACEYCDLTYKRWPSLKRHEKTHLESDEIFFRCNVCWKRHTTEDELKIHMTQHGNPRYRCQVCDEQFHRKYLFDNHFLLVHATPEDIENSKKEIIYDTLMELSTKTDTA